MAMNDARVVYKGGAWDPFHVGHLNVLQFAASLGDILVVGVATDAWIRETKHREPLYPFCDRIRIISELRCVDFVVPGKGTADLTYLDLFHVNIYVINPISGIGDSVRAKRQKRGYDIIRKSGVRIVRFPKTPNISSTAIRGGFNV